MPYHHLGVIGGGNMAQAIVLGALNKEIWPDEICIANPHLEKLTLLRGKGCKVTTDNREAAQFGNIVLLAVKPQIVEGVLDEIADLLEGRTVVSIVAGYSRSWLRSRLPKSAVICAMPNTPLTVGRGATAITPMDDVPKGEYLFVSKLFYGAGGVFVVPEEHINDVIPVNGSSPAFFFHLAEVMAQEAVKRGFQYDAAIKMVAQTMAGSAEMILKSGKSALQLKRDVCSPGGTTLAGLTAFDDHDLEGMIADVFDRCIARAGELGK